MSDIRKYEISVPEGMPGSELFNPLIEGNALLFEPSVMGKYGTDQRYEYLADSFKTTGGTYDPVSHSGVCGYVVCIRYFEGCRCADETFQADGTVDYQYNPGRQTLSFSLDETLWEVQN